MKHGAPVEYTILDPGNAPGPRYPYYPQQQGPPQGPPPQGYTRSPVPPQQHDGMPPQTTGPPGPGGMYHGGRGPR